MSGKEILGIQETEDGRKIEISFERVASWTLVFTNAFFVSYFFAISKELIFSFSAMIVSPFTPAPIILFYLIILSFFKRKSMTSFPSSANSR